jgi:hypothetical protein
MPFAGRGGQILVTPPLRNYSQKMSAAKCSAEGFTYDYRLPYDLAARHDRCHRIGTVADEVFPARDTGVTFPRRI